MAPRSKPKTGEMPVDSITPADDERLAEAEVPAEPAEAQPPEGVVLEDPEFDRVLPDGEATEAELELLRQAQEVIAAEQAAEAAADPVADQLAADAEYSAERAEAEPFPEEADAADAARFFDGWAFDVGFQVKYILTNADIVRHDDAGQPVNSLAPGDVLPAILVRECTEVDAWDLLVFVPGSGQLLPVGASARCVAPDGDPPVSLGGHWFF